MAEKSTVLTLEAGVKDLRGSFSPRDGDIRINKLGQFVRVNESGQPAMAVNSMLSEDEWAEVERAVLAAATYPLRVVNDLRSRGLTAPLGGVGSLETRWYTASQMTRATVNMTGRGRAERDLPEMLQDAVPVPVIYKEFSIDWRTLAASRRLGDGLDVTAAVEATRVVAEEVESIVMNGNASIQLNGRPIYGLRTHPKRRTDTAANFGGGDWGTATNILATVAGMVNAANVQNNYGPFLLYVSQTQYNQAALFRYADGSGDTPLAVLRALPMIEDVRMLPTNVLPDGELLLLQATREYIEIAEAMPIQTREWTSGDGVESMFKVLTIVAPKIKARQGEETGIVHATGA
jgi:uncharacterized linocin/CFP29 family protein